MDEDITLDLAIDQFDHSPSVKVAAQLLKVATQYHRDEMIADGTLRDIVGRVAEWLDA